MLIHQSLKQKWKLHFSLFLVIVLGIFLDLYSKYKIKNCFLNEICKQEIAIMPFLNIISAFNRGVSFGMLSDILWGPIIISIITSLIIIIVIMMMIYEKNKIIQFGFALIISGGIGNLVDRIAHGEVFDFIDLYWKHLHWPTFNVADILVFIGVAIVILISLVKK